SLAVERGGCLCLDLVYWIPPRVCKAGFQILLTSVSRRKEPTLSVSFLSLADVRQDRAWSGSRSSPLRTRNAKKSKIALDLLKVVGFAGVHDQFGIGGIDRFIERGLEL